MKVTTAIRSKVLSLAHQLCKSAKLDFSTAQKKAWAVLRLKAAMQESEAVSFAYVKKSNGEVRPAIGTTKSDCVPATLGNGKEKPATIVTYFDRDTTVGVHSMQLTSCWLRNFEKSLTWMRIH